MFVAQSPQILALDQNGIWLPRQTDRTKRLANACAGSYGIAVPYQTADELPPLKDVRLLFDVLWLPGIVCGLTWAPRPGAIHRMDERRRLGCRARGTDALSSLLTAPSPRQCEFVAEPFTGRFIGDCFRDDRTSVPAASSGTAGSWTKREMMSLPM